MEQPIANPAMHPAVQAALSRRGLGTPGGQGALTQVSPDAPMANPVPQPMNPSDMTQASAPSGTPAPTTPPKFEPQDRTDLITVALIEQMKNDNKLVKEQTKMAKAAPQPTPQPTPQGGGGYGYQKPMGGPTWSQPMPVSQMQGGYGMGKDYSGMNNYGKGF